ncbi:hypothetical protein [Phage f2b1]|nr:hypothetical protein [Phage f2b1]
MTNLRDSLYESFPDPNKKIEELGESIKGKATEHWIDVTKYSSLQAALNDAPVRGVGRVFVPRSVYTVTSTITIPAGVDVDFFGSTLSVPKGVTFNVLEINNGSNQKVSNVKIVESAHNFTGVGNGVVIKGNSESVTLENVYVEGCNIGINIAADNTYKNKRIILKECRTDWAKQFGVNVDNTLGLTLDNCFAYNNWFDGFKLRKSAKNVVIKGGESSNNGESIVQAGNGNGIDCYAGGENYLIHGLITEGNRGSGIYIKTGDLNDQTGELFGYVRNAQIIGVQCRNNTGNGLDINRVNADDATGSTYPLVSHISVIGGIFEGNLQSGMYLRGRNMNVSDPICKNNQNHGINVANVHDVNITNPICTGNGRATAGSYHGINLNKAKRINITNPICNGADGDYITTDDYSAQTKYQKYGVYVAVDCIDGITIKNPKITNSTNTYHIYVGMTTGSCIIDFGSWALANAYGSVGSTFVYNGAVYMKKSGAPNDYATGWVAL